MNKIFSFLVVLTIAILLFTTPEKVLESMTAGGEKAVQLSLVLIAIYAVWLSLLELLEKTKLDQKITKLLLPLCKKLFGKQSTQTYQQISINLTSNMLGMGNAATPSGIKAMQGLDKGRGKLTKPMAMFMILNTTAIQLLPTTVIGLRVSYGSTSPSSIVLPTLVATSISTLVGIVLVHFFHKLVAKKYTESKTENQDE